MKKRVSALLKIVVSLVPGRCRWCGCTYDRPCANGCGWADRAQTLCTECVPIDTAMETARGRRELADYLQDSSFPDMHAMPALARPQRKASAPRGRR